MNLLTAKELRELQKTCGVEREVEQILKGARQWALNNTQATSYRQYFVYPSKDAITLLCQLGYTVENFEDLNGDDRFTGIQISW